MNPPPIILGHRGLLGSALHRRMPNALIFPRSVDLRVASQVDAMFRTIRETRGFPSVVYMAAGRVGGIRANINRPADFIADNLAIALNVIEACRVNEVRMLVMPGSSCMYPRVKEGADQERREADLLTGMPEPTNLAYAMAKLSAFTLCQAYRVQHGLEYLAPIPCNLYGPGDNYNEETSHFVPALIRRIHDAKQQSASTVRIWGSGRPRRELMHVDDCARIMTELVDKEARGIINIGTGVDKTIRDWAILMAQAADYRGSFSFDQESPDGIAAKCMNVDRMYGYGCRPEILPQIGLKATYDDFAANGARRK